MANWRFFGQTPAKLEDRKVKINGNKVTLSFAQNGVLNSRGFWIGRHWRFYGLRFECFDL